MPQFLAETYVPSNSASDLADVVRSLEAAAGDAGSSVRYVRTIAVPGDETYFHVFEGPSVEAIEEVGRRADLPFDRSSKRSSHPGPEHDESLA